MTYSVIISESMWKEPVEYYIVLVFTTCDEYEAI